MLGQLRKKMNGCVKEYVVRGWDTAPAGDKGEIISKESTTAEKREVLAEAGMET